MPLAQMQRSGSNVYVARLLELGVGEAERIERLRERFPAERMQSILAADRQGGRAWIAGFELTGGGPGERVLARDVPDDGYGGRGYRYYTLATLTDPSTGGTYNRVVTIESASSLDFPAVSAQVQDIVTEIYGPEARRRVYQDMPAGLVVSGLEVTAIERADI